MKFQTGQSAFKILTKISMILICFAVIGCASKHDVEKHPSEKDENIRFRKNKSRQT